MSDEIRYEDDKFKAFNESLDEDGDLVVGKISFQPSRVLYELAIEAYREAYQDFLERQYEEIKETVFHDYPACIAYNFRLSERGEGSTDPVRKLLHLKDSWESIIFVFYAIILGEVRSKGADLKAVQVFVSHDTSGNPICASLNTDKILSDALKQKLHNMKAIVHHVKSNSLGFQCGAIDLSIFDDLLQLQEIRNDLSHHTAPTREQAEAELKIVLPLFREMLLKTRFLEGCKILRFESLTTDCRCETFNGHSLNREYESFRFAEPQKNYVIGLGQEQLFIFWDGQCFSLSPFLHFDRDATGHESYVCAYKGKRQGKYWFEPVKTRTEKAFDRLQPRFDLEKDRIIELVVP